MVSTSTGRIAGKVILITGAGNGIGKAVAEVAAAEGGHVAALDYDGDAASATVRDIGGADNISLRADVSDFGAVTDAVDKVFAHYGRIDALANVAGLMDLFAPTEDFSPDGWDRVMNVNVRGTAFMMQAVLKHMLKANSGAIVNTASTSAYKSGGGGIAYAASKGAVVSLTRQAAYEVADRGIRVNAIAPGATQTNFFQSSQAVLGALTPAAQHFCEKAMNEFGGSIALGRYADPVEIARAAIFLASDEASYITGTTLTIDGGVTI